MKTLTLISLDKEINISVKIDNLINFDNASKNDANIIVVINDKALIGQVQFIPEWGEYSTSYNGNDFYNEIQEALLSEYKSDDLYDEHGLKTDSCIELTEEVMPKIAEFICNFVAENAN